MYAFPWPASLQLDTAVLVLAAILDLALPELPSALHPVRWMGSLTKALERLAPASGTVPQLLAGFGIAIVVPAASGFIAGAAAAALHNAGTIAYVAGGAVLLQSTFTVRGLVRAGAQTARLLATGDLVGARTSLRSLVSRDPMALPAGLAAGAAVESLAENTTDSFIGPWMAFALFGIAGAFAYRAINTLDSMIGYRGRYEYLGKASARIDDALNLLPTRLSAALVLASGAMLGLPASRGWRIMRRDRGLTASPNAGWTMSAMSGLLGARLEKTGYYCLGAEFPEPVAADIGKASWVVWATALLGLLAAGALLVIRHTIAGQA